MTFVSTRLDQAVRKTVRLCVGVLSGTSMDAAEAALCKISGTGAAVRLELIAHDSRPFPRELREAILGAKTPHALSDLNFELGEVFSVAVLSVIAKAGIRPEDVDLIGSHGQTVAHVSPNKLRSGSTLQLGEPSVIAERTGIPTVSDFRVRDMAVGGQGAPLVPYADWALFRKPGTRRAFLNVGGIANVSVVSDALEDTVAFDTGPGNMILDALAAKATSGALAYDRDGALSGQGRPLRELLSDLMKHPFLAERPPKSCGREEFGQPFAEALWARRPAPPPNDLLATAAAFTVESIAEAMKAWVLPGGPVEAMYVSGGGSRNPTLMAGLKTALAPLPVRPLGALGFLEEAKEAACFALLASECLSGTAQNLPSVTGATRRVILGKISP